MGSLTEAVEADRIALAPRDRRSIAAASARFLNVLDGERSLYSAEDAVAQSDLTLTQQTIALYKALGAGWQRGETALLRVGRKRARRRRLELEGLGHTGSVR